MRPLRRRSQISTARRVSGRILHPARQAIASRHPAAPPAIGAANFAHWRRPHPFRASIFLLIPLSYLYALATGRLQMSQAPAVKVFVNYRRGEDSGTAGRLYDRLEQVLGRDNLFMDVNTITAGSDFVATLEGWVMKCDVLLALIGKGWADLRGEDGERRLDDPKDFVRIEIASALTIGKRVIPVLVNGAEMPAGDSLPEPLKSLARCNAVRLSHESFCADVQGLVSGLHTALTEIVAEQEAEAWAKASGNRDIHEIEVNRDTHEIEEFLKEWPSGKYAKHAKAIIKRHNRWIRKIAYIDVFLDGASAFTIATVLNGFAYILSPLFGFREFCDDNIVNIFGLTWFAMYGILSVRTRRKRTGGLL
jgi:TIR domain